MSNLYNTLIKDITELTVRYSILVHIKKVRKIEALKQINLFILALPMDNEDKLTNIELTKSLLKSILETTVQSKDEEKTLLADIKKAGIEASIYVLSMDLEIKDTKGGAVTIKGGKFNFLDTEMFPPMGSINTEKLSLYDKVTIGHTLYTNFLVTSDGTQMPSKDFHTPAAPELMGKVATVIEVGASIPFMCGHCNETHLADTKIAFEEFTMEFYLDSCYLKPFRNEK